eukprot:1143435-Amphidinium_carterae.1
MSDIAAAAVEGVVHGLSYREMDCDGSLDAQGQLPLKSIELQVEQTVRHMQAHWSEKQSTLFTQVAIQSLELKDTNYEMPKRRERWLDCTRWKKCFNRMVCGSKVSASTLTFENAWGAAEEPPMFELLGVVLHACRGRE